MTPAVLPNMFFGAMARRSYRSLELWSVEVMGRRSYGPSE